MQKESPFPSTSWQREERMARQEAPGPEGVLVSNHPPQNAVSLMLKAVLRSVIDVLVRLSLLTGPKGDTEESRVAGQTTGSRSLTGRVSKTTIRNEEEAHRLLLLSVRDS